MITDRSLSLVVPVYNESAIIEKLVRDYHAEIAAKFKTCEFIVVNDCSTDNTLEILRKLERELGLTIIDLPVNRGHGAALRAGLEKASCDLAFHTDSDYQHDPKDFWKLYEHISEADAVLGYRHQRQDARGRIWLSRFVRFIDRVLFGAHLKDANIPFKLYKRDSLARALSVVRRDALVPSIMINLALLRLGYKLAEVPVAHTDRKTGKPSLVKWKLIRFCFRAFGQLLVFRLRPLGKPA